MSAHAARRHAAPRTRRAVVTLGTAVVAFAVSAGAASAYWRSTGTGTGSASVGTISALTGLTGTASSTGLLVPGGTGSLVVAVSNPNSTPITVTAISTGSVAVGVTGAAGTCTSTDPVISLVTPSAGLPFTIAAGGSSTVTLANAVSMGTAAASGCQSATFSVPVTLTGRTN